MGQALHSEKQPHKCAVFHQVMFIFSVIFFCHFHADPSTLNVATLLHRAVAFRPLPCNTATSLINRLLTHLAKVPFGIRGRRRASFVCRGGFGTGTGSRVGRSHCASRWLGVVDGYVDPAHIRIAVGLAHVDIRFGCISIGGVCAFGRGNRVRGTSGGRFVGFQGHFGLFLELSRSASKFVSKAVSSRR